MAFITIAGEQLIAQKQGNSEVLNISHFVLANIAGLGAEPGDRIEALPDIADIVDTKAVTRQGYVNANQVVYSLSLDSTIGDYTFNWVGLKSSEGVLVACAHIAPQVKTANDGATPGNNLTRNFLLAFSGIQATTAIAVPAETWQIDFTTRLLQIDERERLSNFDIYGNGAFFLDGFKVEFVSNTTYRVKAGIGYVGGIRCLLESDTNITVSSPPKGVWIDASLQGDINGVSEMVAFTVSLAELANYTDGLGFDHFVFKIADVPSSGVVTDLRPIAPVYLLRSDVVPLAEAEAGTATTARAWTAQRVKQSIDKNVPVSSQDSHGKIRLAAISEVLIGTDHTKAVTPAGLAAENTQSRILQKIGYVPVQQGTGISQVSNVVKIGWSALQKLLCTVDNTNLGAFVFESQLEFIKGLLINSYRKGYQSFHNIVSSDWVSLGDFSQVITVTKGPVEAHFFARVTAVFTNAVEPAACRLIVNGGTLVNVAIDYSRESGISGQTVSKTFILKGRATLPSNGNYLAIMQVRNSPNAPTQNVRINTFDANDESIDGVSIMEINVFKA